MRRLTLAGAALAALVTVAVATPADAITRGGTLDGDDHPYVGLMVAQDADGNPLWRCSGTMISPRVYVTAGHCTEPPAVQAEIWFETDVESGIPDNGYPYSGPTSVTGTTYVHPLYDPNAFFLFDLGVVVLDADAPVTEFAELPAAGLVETLQKGRKLGTVTAVGYGLQAASANPVKPEKTVAERVRYQADLMIVDTNGVAGIGNLPDSNSMILSGDAKHGGTCFGDSGGPSLVGETLVAVTSFGLNDNCAGIGGVFRIDRDQELNWISSFLG
jgi:secreted trypsin-like serine protease